MNKHTILLAAMLATGFISSHASAAGQGAQDAAARYDSDKKLCADEREASLRMQCLRDAKATYTKAMESAKSSTQGNGHAVCATCGKVTSVHVTEQAGQGGALGVVAGGVAGALLGHQVGGGTGRDLATVAGAAGGAYAGNQVEKKMTAKKVWTVAVQYENGHQAKFTFDKDPGMVAGDKVKNAGHSIVRY
ncbi:glycine zipper 2TM domain-containing protein [Duganella sp. LX20W]|uniref:Glycine zipper 2TM domain-containing protein n=1 Tax=Rugamonas brunnea TaxID=2758569 RepID=A0A7W2EUG3_9BURK|nr:glycine zipper 2TM domain-containing protein [Rugamonas brunnea]MBA5638843.1 glycine zipper 2TM domain-containing protein [Rugamonas brunnea]